MVNSDLMEQFDKWQALNSLNIDDLVLFSRQMYSLTKANVPITRALLSLTESTRNKALAGALKKVSQSLEEGLPIGMAMGQHPKIFSTLFISIIKVGEETGGLDLRFPANFSIPRT